MEVALGSATSLLGKVWTALSDTLVAAYVDSLQLGHNSEQIKDKLLHAQGLLHNAQLQGSHNPGLQGLLEKLGRDAEQAEDLLDEVHYFQIHDKLHGTHYATTQKAGHQALHAETALRHTLGSWFQCCSCSRIPKTKRDAGDDAAAAAVACAPRHVTNNLGTLLRCFSCSCTPKSKRNGGDDDDAAAAVAGVGDDGAAAPAVAGVSNSNSVTADDGDMLLFDRVSISSKIKSRLQDMETHCDSVSNLLGTIPSSSTALAVALHRPQTASMIN